MNMQHYFYKAIMLLALMIPGAGQADEGSALLEAKVKAAYVYNFTRFIRWPDTGTEPFTLCIIGDGRIAGLLEKLKNHGTAQRAFNLAIDADTASNLCHVAYISANADDIPATLDRYRKKPVLTIGDSSTFTERGGIIRLFSENGRIRFEIDTVNAKQAGLTISSKLLELASSVR